MSTKTTPTKDNIITLGKTVLSPEELRQNNRAKVKEYKNKIQTLEAEERGSFEWNNMSLIVDLNSTLKALNKKPDIQHTTKNRLLEVLSKQNDLEADQSLAA